MLYVLKNRNFWIMLLGDAALVIAAYLFAHFLRFDGNIPQPHLGIFYKTVSWLVVLKLACFMQFQLYRGMWRYTSIYDMFNVIKASMVSSALFIMIVAIAFRLSGFSRAVLVIDFVLTLLFIGGFRVAIRLYHYRPSSNGMFKRAKKEKGRSKRILIIGAGDAGEKLLREIMENPGSGYTVAGFIDDSAKKIRQTIHGVPVLGTLQEMGQLAKQYEVDQIIIAAPSASAMQMRRMVNFCKSTGLPYKTLPGLSDLFEGRVSIGAVREVRYEDLLGREPVNLDIERIGEYLKGKRVLVSGGAGSIGSELCRQIARFSPERLILVDKNESGLYEMELELISRYPAVRTISVLGSIQHNGRLETVFRAQKPQVVFHAAAYKHVPIMEIQPWEAVYNNILGARTIMELCSAGQVERCVLVSTDKAVRPTNVMGASKRVMEILMQAYAMENNNTYMAVRFGNVVGSIGSVVPLFKRQIEMGGPVTVTHPEVTRYFMTIPEACSLILQAGAIGRGGEIFVLKMGTPIRIADMARDIITLSGFKPEEEIEIKYIGLRPGEKLYEELITEGESITATEHRDIMVLNADCCMPREVINDHIERLVSLAKAEDARGIKEELRRIVPEYMPQGV
ncbi:MAG: polysaccharide biosynthesis protein [Deltaproteobacteria bacterium]|nr:polysaccharide biosynthesis protein [Deltaproteobacteria bacterium]